MWIESKRKRLDEYANALLSSSRTSHRFNRIDSGSSVCEWLLIYFVDFVTFVCLRAIRDITMQSSQCQGKHRVGTRSMSITHGSTCTTSIYRVNTLGILINGRY